MLQHLYCRCMYTEATMGVNYGQNLVVYDFELVKYGDGTIVVKDRLKQQLVPQNSCYMKLKLCTHT